MALTKSFKETVKARAERDPAFREALLTEAIEQLLAGEMEIGKAVLRDYINATVGFEKLAEETGTPPKSLMRMLGPKGNPRNGNLFAMIGSLQRVSELHSAVAAGHWPQLREDLPDVAPDPDADRASALETIRRRIRASLDDPRPSIPADEALAQLRAFHAEQVKAAPDTIKVTPSSGNVFADLGFDNPEEELRRAAIIREVRGIARAEGYEVEIAFDETAGHFHGEVAGLRDVITFQGRTALELCDALLGSVADYQAFRNGF